MSSLYNTAAINSLVELTSTAQNKIKDEAKKLLPDYVNVDEVKSQFLPAYFKDTNWVKVNPQKRQKIPTVNCSTHVPGNLVGSTIGNIYKEVFKRSIIISTKKDFHYEKCDNFIDNFIAKKENKRKHVKYISIFEYIFTIQSVDNEKIIHICKNDISEILRTFSKTDDF